MTHPEPGREPPEPPDRHGVRPGTATDDTPDDASPPQEPRDDDAPPGR